MYRPDLFQEAGQEKTLKRGVNLTGWWEGKRQNKFGAQDLYKIKKLGFDFVRVPVTPRWLTVEDAREQTKIIHELRCDMIDVLHSGLAVVLDLHALASPEENLDLSNGDAVVSRLEGLWKKMEPVVSGLPKDGVYLGLLNEPSDKIPDWWALQGRLIASLRNVFPDYVFIATDLKGGYWSLHKKTPYDDKNVIYDFHFYQPMFFTHHHADWSKPPPDPREKTDHVQYPSALGKNDDPSYERMTRYIAGGWNKEKLAGLLKNPVTWNQQTKAKLICLEFGVYRFYVDADSRARWLKDMRDILEANNIPWALWEYNSGFGLVDKHGQVDEKAAEALGLDLGSEN